MIYKRNKTIGKIGMLFLASVSLIHAQNTTTVEAVNQEISDNLNLEAVASIFGDSKDLEEFELKLNNPDAQVSNLDINEDGNVDYLRVVETTENDTHLIAIQSVLGEDFYQDVATIEVEKDSSGKIEVQIVGNVYLYGPRFIIEPSYIYNPPIFAWFWRPFYRPYHSIYYWGYYPKHYHFWKPVHNHYYKKNIHIHINVKHTYKHTTIRHSTNAAHLHTKTIRNDYAVKHPRKSHSVRAVNIKKQNGTKKSVVAVNKADGTKKRVASIKKPNGSKKSIRTKKNSASSKKVVTVRKKSNAGRTVKKARKSSGQKRKSAARTKSKRKN